MKTNSSAWFRLSQSKPPASVPNAIGTPAFIARWNDSCDAAQSWSQTGFVFPRGPFTKSATVIVGQYGIFLAAIVLAVSSSITSPCSIESTPAARAIRCPVGVIEWAATFFLRRCVSSTMAFISSCVKFGIEAQPPSGVR